MGGGESSHEVGPFQTQGSRSGRSGTHGTGTSNIAKTFSVHSVIRFLVTRTFGTSGTHIFTRQGANVGRKE